MKNLWSALLCFAWMFTLGCSSNTPASPAPTPPAAPVGLTASAGNSQVMLSWTAATGATSYNLYYATSTGVTTASATKAVGLTTTNYTATGLTNGTAYFFVVTAISGAGESVLSNQATATPFPPPPSAPSALTATPGNAQAVLSWTASAGATSYNLYYSLNTGVTTATGTKVGNLNGTTYTQTGLTNGSTYFYIVTAVGLGGESLASVQASANPTAPIAAAPATLTATPGNAQASLSWTASPGAVSYNLYYGTSPALSIATGTKVGAVSGTSYTVTGLTNSTLYYFLVTAVNTGGESAASVITSATPTNGTTIALTPGTATTATLQATATASLVYTFPSTALSTSAVATISSITLAALPTPLIHSTDTFVASFSLSLNPLSINTFNAPIGISGSTGSSIPLNTTLNLAVLQNNAWVDAATMIVGSTGSLNENLASITLPGLLTPGTYLLYQPTPGTSTAVSNLGIALLGDGGRGMADDSDGLQIVHLHSPTGTLLASPTVTDLDYATNSYGVSAPALSPDGSQGLVVDTVGGPNHFFSDVQTGTPFALADSSGITDGVSVAMLPTGDEAVISNDDPAKLFVLSGILSGKAVTAATIPISNRREGLVLSADGKVLLARGPFGLAVFAVAPTSPTPGTNGGTVSHAYTQLADLATLGSDPSFADGRGGMALSPVDSSRAVIVQFVTGSSTIRLLTGLTSVNPAVGTSLPLLGGSPFCVSVTPDGKLAVVGSQLGLSLYSGVDTGTLKLVSYFSGSYNLGATAVGLGSVPTLGITLDGKYVVAADSTNSALLVIPFTSNGFAAAPAAVLSYIGIPINSRGDNLLIH